MTWSWEIKTSEYSAFIEKKKERKEKIIILPTCRLENEIEITESWEKEIKNSKEWDEQIKRIERWEEKMKNELKIDTIQWFAKEIVNEKELHLFGFKIKSPIAGGLFSLEEAEKYAIKMFNTFNEEIHFFLVLEKVKNEKGISFTLNETYPIQRKYMRKNENLYCPGIHSHFKKTRYSILYDFYTHQSFLEDVVDIISNEPNIRLKKLF